jgi:UDP-glucose 4-epimerase
MKTNQSRRTSLVTGGAGFIGSHVVDELVKLEHRVLILDDLSGGFRENVNPEAELIAGSITDVGVVNRIFDTNRIDYVYHLAAYAAEGLSHFIRAFNYENNTVGSEHLITAAINHQIECFVFTSSIAVYGSGQTPMTEEMQPMPEDPYGIAKYAVELDLRSARHMFGLNYIIFRPHNVYGERQNIGDPYRNVVGIFMNNILRGLPCRVFGDGSQTRAFSHVSDVAPAIAKSALRPELYGEVFNIGADVPYSVRELATKVQEAMGADTGIEFLEARKEVLHAFSDHSKCDRVFGGSRKLSLEEGLARMAAWVQAVGAREGKPFGSIDIRRNLPDAWSRLCTKVDH